MSPVALAVLLAGAPVEAPAQPLLAIKWEKKFDEALKKAPNPIDPVGYLYDTARAPYDPTKMALFHDILFSTGFE